MSNYISFSLYDDLPKYCSGAIRNSVRALEFFPGWKCIFWMDKSAYLTSAGMLSIGVNSEVVRTWEMTGMPENKMFWRLLVNDLPDCDRYIIRDTDSRIGEREAAAVNEWVESGKKFHSCRDHPAHAREINGGMFGAVRGAIPSMRQLIDEFDPENKYGADQDFLCRSVWPLVKNDCLQHDSVSRHLFPGSIPFPTKRNGSYRFLGEVFAIGPNGEDEPREGDLQFIDPWKD